MFVNTKYFSVARLLLTCSLILLVVAACRRESGPAGGLPDPSSSSAVEPPSAVSGILVGWPDGAPIPSRGVALCRISGSDCSVQPPAIVTDPLGRFRFENEAAGRYYVLVESGMGDFAATIEARAGENLRPRNWVWIESGGLPVEPQRGVNVPAAEWITRGTEEIPPVDPGEYATTTFLIEGSPFLLAHTIEEDKLRGKAHLFELALPEENTVSVPVIPPRQPDYSAIRTELSTLSREETPLLDPAVVARWTAFYGGDDSAYSDGDVAVIRALRERQSGGGVYRIGDVLLTRVDVADRSLVKSVGYMVYDTQTGEPTVIGWIDPTTGDVIESSTGLHLNVLDDPGEFLQEGPNGEQFYHYGFSYYRRWRRILPDPVIDQIEAFRTVGAEHVRRNLEAYQQASEEYDQGDLGLINWDITTPIRVAEWLPPESAPPTLVLPDSGTIDVRRERFLQAVASQKVVVDEGSVISFLNGPVAQNGFFYTEDVTVQQVIDDLLQAYTSGHLYSDMEAAIILAGTYGTEGPLRIRISGRIDYGALVPRGSRNEILIGDGEVADVVLGYPGTMTARWPHEIAHVLEFRDPRNTVVIRPSGGSRCEPLKYMMEYMWWVERYPYDAPDADWMPVGSGLTLARLLTGTYPNSGC